MVPLVIRESIKLSVYRVGEKWQRGVLLLDQFLFMSSLQYVSETCITLLHTEMVSQMVTMHAQQGKSSESLIRSLDSMGCHTGLRITERLLHQSQIGIFTPEESIKFVCRTLWPAAYNHPVSKVMGAKREHCYVLIDNNFSLTRSNSFRIGDPSATNTVDASPDRERLSVAAPPSSPEPTPVAGAPVAPSVIGVKDFLLFSMGLIRGTLETLGHRRVVVHCKIVSINEIHFQVDFQINVKP